MTVDRLTDGFHPASLMNIVVCHLHKSENVILGDFSNNFTYRKYIKSK